MFLIVFGSFRLHDLFDKRRDIEGVQTAILLFVEDELWLLIVDQQFYFESS